MESRALHAARPILPTCRRGSRTKYISGIRCHSGRRSGLASHPLGRRHLLRQQGLCLATLLIGRTVSCPHSSKSSICNGACGHELISPPPQGLVAGSLRARGPGLPWRSGTDEIIHIPGALEDVLNLQLDLQDPKVRRLWRLTRQRRCIPWKGQGQMHPPAP